MKSVRLFTLILIILAWLNYLPLSILCADETVISIDFISNIKIDEEELRALISIKEASSFQAFVVDKSIRELYATGIFRNIQVYKESAEEGVKLYFYLWGKDAVRKVTFTGNKFVSDKRLKRNIPLEERNIYSEESLRESVEKIREIYRNLSFFDVKVQYAVRGVGSGAVDLDFKIDEGNRKRIDMVEFNVEDPVVREILTKKFIYRDIYYDKNKFDRTIQEMTEYLVKYGYWNAKIYPPEFDYLPDKNMLTVVLKVDPGIKYRIEFKGNKSFSKDELLEAMEFERKTGAYSFTMIEEWKKNLKNFYQKNGYAMAEINISEFEEGSNSSAVVIDINEGDPVRIQEIIFEGNKFFGDKKLRSLMLTKERGILSGNIDFLYDWLFDYYPKGILLSDRLKDDLENIEFFYRENGFLYASVNLKSIEYLEKDKALRIVINIKEGEQIFIKEIQFAGNSVFPDEELRRIANIETQKPFNPFLADEGVKLLKNYYDDHGYIFSKVELKNYLTDDGKGIVIRYEIDEGPCVYVNKVYFSGNKVTKGYVLRRELTFKEGEVLTPLRVFESQRKIYRLGFIERVSIDLKNVDPDGGVDLLVKVKERKPRRFDFKIGYGTAEGLRSSLEFTQKNLGGRGQTLFARMDLSYWLTDMTPFSDIFTSEENYFNTRVFNAGFIWPWLFRQNMDFRINYIYQERRRIYQLRSHDIILGIESDLTKHFHGGVQYQVRFREPLQDGTPDMRFEEKRRLGFLSLFLLHDTRNNPFEPYKGHLQTYRIDFASRNLIPEGEYDYLKFFIKGDFFTRPFKKLVTAFSVRGGYGYILDGGEIPIEERFFLGGTTSVRGFEEDSLGPRTLNPDTGKYIPAGGDFMLGYNVELRWMLRKGIGFVIFTDGGNVWAKADETDLGRVMSLKDLRESAGVGFRYATPIGPLRLDLGIKLDKRKDEPLNEWHFFVGNMF